MTTVYFLNDDLTVRKVIDFPAQPVKRAGTRKRHAKLVDAAKLSRSEILLRLAMAEYDRVLAAPLPPPPPEIPRAFSRGFSWPL